MKSNSSSKLRMFLEALKLGRATHEGWQENIVTHFADNNEERARIEIARIFMSFDRDFREICDDRVLVGKIDDIAAKYFGSPDESVGR